MSLKKILAAGAALSMISGAAFAGHHESKDKTSHDKMTEKADIVDTAAAAGTFNTLVAAIQAAGLEEALRKPGQLTVFAPTDAAFAALPDGTVASLLQPENKDQLVSILTYHVVPGKTKSKQLAGKTLDVTTLNGAKLSVDGTDGVTINGVDVVSADIYASNGIIHVIDEVLMPPAE